MSFFIITGACGCKSNNQATTTGTQDVYAGIGKATDPIPLVPEARIGTLPNGLKYYILKNDKPKGRAFLTLVVNAGPLFEKDDEQEFAHCVKEIAFKAIRKQLQANSLLSATKDAFNSSNSSTVFDETIYNFEVPIQTDKNNIKHIPQKAINIFNSLTHAIKFSQKDIDDLGFMPGKQKESWGLAMHRVDSILTDCSQHSCGYHHQEVIQKVTKVVTPSKLKDFYNKWYRTDNMALVFVGDFDDALLEASLTSNFHAPSPNTPLKRPAYDLSLPKKGHLDAIIITDPDQYTPIKTCLYYKQRPKAIDNNLAACRQYFIDMLIKYMLSERFDKKSSKTSTPYEYLDLGHITTANLSRYYMFNAWVKEGSTLEEVIKSLLEEKERILRYGWTDSEVEMTKPYIMSHFERDVINYSDKSSSDFVDIFLKHFLAKENVISNDQWKLMAAKEMFPTITTKDLTNAAKDFFDDLTIVVWAAEKDKLLSKEKIYEIIDEAKKSKVSPPVHEVIDYKLLSKPPKPGSIVKESIDIGTGAVMLDLSNGAKVILKQTVKKDNKDSRIVLRALAKGGTMAVTDKDDIPSARFASKVLHNLDIGQYSRKVNNIRLTGKGSSLQTDIDAFERSLQGYSSSAKDTKDLFELIYLRFTTSKFDLSKVKDLIESDKTSYNYDPASTIALNKVLYDNNPHFNIWDSNIHSRLDFLESSSTLHKIFEMSDYSKINPERALKFLKECFNPADFTFVFVGNIDLKMLKPHIETYIASIPLSKPLVNQKFEGRPTPSKMEIFERYDYKPGVHMLWAIEAKYSLKLKAVSKVLDHYINILFNEFKPYEVTVDLNPFIDELSLNIFAPCDPISGFKKLTSEVLNDIQKIALGNIDAYIFSESKESVQHLYESAILFGGGNEAFGIAKSYACSAALYNTPLGEFERFPSVCQAVSKEDLKGLASQLLKGKYYQIISHPKIKNIKQLIQ
ncbi:peptidase M16 [Endomicrobiia bacterium]|nr:peptidase M16 [Endomicrobiia bacterium]